MTSPTPATGPCADRSAPHLTPRELSILELAARGRSNEQIALSLYLSRQTVAHRLSDVFRKLEASARADAIARAYVLGILAPAEWPPRLTGRRCLHRPADAPPRRPADDPSR